MRHAFTPALMTAFLCVPLAAQEAKPQFEAADVHASPAGATESGGFLPGGRIEFRATTLLRLISTAYSIPEDRIAGGPSWIDTDRFDIVAKSAPSASRIAVVNMMQSLLEERFGLSVERGEKPMPVYALTVGRKGAPKQSAKPGDPKCARRVEEGTLYYECSSSTLASLAESLPAIAPAYFSGRPVVDRTGLTGVYDFKLQWVGRGQLPAGAEGLKDSRSIFSSLEKELGLTLEAQTAPIPVITIARVNRTPTENPSGVTEKLGATPTEFDVADIRPSGPAEKEDFKVENGRIEAKAIALRDLIEFACNVEGDALKGGGKWLDSERFDVVAKTAPTESADTLRVMLRNLLGERFGLKTHEDRQPVTVYALTAVKPKLKQADPAERSTCRMSMAEGERAYICTNVTMTQFADRLRDAAGGYIDHPVVDLTGLKGSYDFTATWAPRGRTLGRGGPAAAKNAPDAMSPGEASAAPTGELTVFEALSRQLGLKLAVQKAPMPVVVIDRLERKPTAN